MDMPPGMMRDEARQQREDVALTNLGFEPPKRGRKLSISSKILPVEDQDLRPGQLVTITISGRVSGVKTGSLEIEVDDAQLSGTEGPEAGLGVPEGGTPPPMMPPTGGM